MTRRGGLPTHGTLDRVSEAKGELDGQVSLHQPTRIHERKSRGLELNLGNLAFHIFICEAQVDSRRIDILVAQLFLQSLSFGDLPKVPYRKACL